MPPTYDYICGTCEHEFEVIKSMNDGPKPEICERCFMPAEKIFQPAQISPAAKAFDAHFNYGLGKPVKSRADIHNELRRIKGETGKDVVEVGSDNLQSVKKKPHSYTITGEDIERVKAQLS